jgi:hypothetical protein
VATSGGVGALTDDLLLSAHEHYRLGNYLRALTLCHQVGFGKGWLMWLEAGPIFVSITPEALCLRILVFPEREMSANEVGYSFLGWTGVNVGVEYWTEHLVQKVQLLG